MAGTIGHVFDEKEHQDVVLVLRGIHTAAKLVAELPKRAVQIRFLDSHWAPPLLDNYQSKGYGTAVTALFPRNTVKRVAL
jgi:hypothetical protein